MIAFLLIINLKEECYMKDKIIDEIVMELGNILSADQLLHVENILYMKLNGYKIEKECCELVTSECHWQKILRTFLATKKLENCSQGTIENYGRCIVMLVQHINKRLKDITTNDLRYYLAWYQETRKISLSYMETLRHYINSFFSWASDEGYIERNPARRLKHVKVPKVIKKPYSATEIEMLKRNAKTERDLAIMELLYSSAARVGEIVSLNREDISFIGKDIVLYGHKGKKERYVYLTASACYHLKKYLENREDDNPALFVSERKPYNRLGKSAIQVMLRKLGGDLNINKVHPHRFRRTFATDALERGVPIEQVQEILGHVKIETTRIYCTVTEESVRSSFRKCMA